MWKYDVYQQQNYSHLTHFLHMNYYKTQQHAFVSGASVSLVVFGLRDGIVHV